MLNNSNTFKASLFIRPNFILNINNIIKQNIKKTKSTHQEKQQMILWRRSKNQRDPEGSSPEQCCKHSVKKILTGTEEKLTK